jgi:hypothetical protein
MGARLQYLLQDIALPVGTFLIGRLLPSHLVDELYAAVRKVEHVDKSVLRAYTARLRGAAASFGPAERWAP